MTQLAGRALVALALAACSQGTTAEEASAVLRAYAARAADPDRSFHLSQTGSVSGGPQPFEIHHELDVSGNDMRGSIDVGAEPIEMAFVGGVTFMKSGGEWVGPVAESDIAGDILDILGYVGDGTSLRLVEGLDEGGAPLFHFRSFKPIPYQSAEMRRLGLPGSIEELELFARSDGVPVRIVFRSRQGLPNREIVTVSSVEFTRWGEPMTIEAPL